MALTVEDQLAIQQLYARYNHAIDAGKATDWAACFTSDGTFDSGQGPAVGTEALVGFANGFHGQMKGKARHWTNNLVIDGDGATARGSCYLMLYLNQDPPTPPVTAATGLYVDALAKAAGEWKFTNRKVHIG